LHALKENGYIKELVTFKSGDLGSIGEMLAAINKQAEITGVKARVCSLLVFGADSCLCDVY
jgi:hypothetical protein